VEKKLQSQRKRGKWLANPTRAESEHNSPSVFTIAAEKLSGKSWKRRKFKQQHFLIFSIFV